MKDRVEKNQPDYITDWKVTIMETWMGLDQNYIDSLVETLSISTKEHDFTMNQTPEAVSCPPMKPLLDEPELITTMDTERELLGRITCLRDEEFWFCGIYRYIFLLNLQGKLIKSFTTKSKNRPEDIAVTRSGDLVYTDPGKRTVNKVENDQIQEVIRLQGWIPNYVCSTFSGDFLVTMVSDDYKQSKVVRYSGSTEKQTIQFDSEGTPLYSSCSSVSENRNLDICVAVAGAVVVVNQAGKLRFRYTGHPSTTKKSFSPSGITKDSQSQILTADWNNHCIHIIDQDGQFLGYIDNCNLKDPWGLCVDTRDNLFVLEFSSGKVKKIKYM
ncbi:tripartite motif-containing protein 2-like [Saccostrea cucullata]|uniref:tripartite motif-containing protein 2-like n=1 Tax=Saccostrea cuccullata TaxID=36930 RepID=UPI002ED14837